MAQSLTIDRGNRADDSYEGTDIPDTVSLRTRILQVVKSAPNHTLRPARLSQELGLSVTDASAELCGLLKAVGPGSSFHFETMEGGVQTMVFSFPSDFEARARATQTQDEWQETLHNSLEVALKIIKVLTAFGLILSTIIVAIAGMIALIAAMVALSRGGDHRSRHHLSRQLRDLFILIRQLLWTYAVFGPVGDGDQDPFFREVAYDMSLVMSLFCGNPASMWFWLRASHLRRRRRRMAQGWGRQMPSIRSDEDVEATPWGGTGMEGVRLVRRGSWGEETLPVPGPGESEQHRGFLSVVVEFLFGPNISAGPSEADKWKLRNAVILEKSQENAGSSIALRELSPYVDSPPKSPQDTNKMTSESLLLVAHFNGVPSSKAKATGDEKGVDSTGADATFIFPEVVAESSVGNHYDDPASILSPFSTSQSRFDNLFYQSEPAGLGRPSGRNLSTNTPSFLTEQPMNFTKLNPRQFFHCLLIATLNFLGVLWFDQSLQVGGILEQVLAQNVVQGLNWALIPVLTFYSKVFFVIPSIRLVYIIIWNEACRSRNARRHSLANESPSKSQDHDQASDRSSLEMTNSHTTSSPSITR